VPIRREVPQLNGSSANFLALVISLSLFVFFSCVAIFWLLKYHQPTDQDRVKRKTELEATRTRAEAVNTSSQTMTGKIGSWFRTRDGKRGQWVRAANEEEEEGSPIWRGRGLPMVDRTDRPRGFAPSMDDKKIRHSQSSSTSTVQMSPITPIPELGYFPRSVPSPDSSVAPPVPSPRMSSYEGYLHGDPFRSMSTEIGEDWNEEGRHFSVQTPGTAEGHMQMRKWDNGTRFQEVIQ
jgi:hypothetical protein